MTQQIPHASANEKYKRKLFVETGMGFVGVKARIIEPYTPPTPQIRARELEITNAPSHLMNMGIASYRATIVLLFAQKSDFNEYLLYNRATHKFYDEKGHIFLGTVESMKVSSHEAQRRHKVELSLILVKKDTQHNPRQFQFLDTQGHWAQDEIAELAGQGILAVLTQDGQEVLYFRPNAFVTRAEFISFMNRTRRLCERVIRE